MLDERAVQRRAAGARRHRSDEGVLRAVRRRLLRRSRRTKGKRLVKVGCFDTRRSTTNVFGWPIERLYALVDLRRREVLSVTDDGVVPIADGDLNYTRGGRRRAARRRASRRMLAQPEGSNFRHRRPRGDVGQLALPRPRRSARRHRDLAGPLAGRRRLALGAVSGLPVRDVRAVHGRRLRLAVADLLRHRRIRRRRPGHAARARASIARRRRRFLPAVFGDDKGEPFTTPERAVRVRAQPRRSDLAPSRGRQPDLRRPRRTSSSSSGWRRRSATTTTCSTGSSTTPPRSRCASAPPASTR